MTKTVAQVFTDGWILPNFNSNTLVLIPKIHSTDSMDHYMPIALANFKHKIITKILAGRLALILLTIVSQEQIAFIQGRQLKDCVSLTYEVVNILNNKCI